ncbi:MAG: molecular chaperone TorD family protein [Rhodospirillales bacterium]|nr:molecular chaperone TorD family protein [Alphaproteobacteria bacterium]MBL6947387.1 molecular chaperone TorD family protein [Rhodospirillales bacterium]
MAEMATARANVYGLLADIFREEPSEALLSKLEAPEFSGALHALNLSLDEVFENASQTQLVEDLALEFTRLFIGPGSHISPNESMHVEGRFGEPNSFWSEQTVKVKKFMEAAGLQVADSFGGMPDHLSAEFEFMQRLVLKEAEAWSNEEHELGTNILEIEKRFYEEHLSQWVNNFCDKVIDATEHPFYRQFSEVAKGFIDFEQENLTTFSAGTQA